MLYELIITHHVIVVMQKVTKKWPIEYSDIIYISLCNVLFSHKFSTFTQYNLQLCVQGTHFILFQYFNWPWFVLSYFLQDNDNLFSEVL